MNMIELVGSQKQKEVATSNGASRLNVASVTSRASVADRPLHSASSEFDQARKPGDNTAEDRIWLTMIFVANVRAPVLAGQNWSALAYHNDSGTDTVAL